MQAEHEGAFCASVHPEMASYPEERPVPCRAACLSSWRHCHRAGTRHASLHAGCWSRPRPAILCSSAAIWPVRGKQLRGRFCPGSTGGFTESGLGWLCTRTKLGHVSVCSSKLFLMCKTSQPARQVLYEPGAPVPSFRSQNRSKELLHTNKSRSCFALMIVQPGSIAGSKSSKSPAPTLPPALHNRQGLPWLTSLKLKRGKAPAFRSL